MVERFNPRDVKVWKVSPTVGVRGGDEGFVGSGGVQNNLSRKSRLSDDHEGGNSNTPSMWRSPTDSAILTIYTIKPFYAAQSAKIMQNSQSISSLRWLAWAASLSISGERTGRVCAPAKRFGTYRSGDTFGASAFAGMGIPARRDRYSSSVCLMSAMVASFVYEGSIFTISPSKPRM